VVDVGGKSGIRFGIVERLAQKNLLDSLGRRLDTARPGKVLTERLTNEVPERHPSRPRDFGRTAVKVAWQQELSPMHV